MKQEESRIQRNCVNWFRFRYHKYTALLFAVPNGGARDRITGARLKAEGVLPGVADLLLFLPRGGYHALCIEMKTEQGRQAATQYDWEKAVTKQGYKYIICRSLDDFMRQVTDYINSDHAAEKES